MGERRGAWLSWAVLVSLTLLCGALAFIQNRWIDQLAQAERERLQRQLQSGLNEVSREFNEEVTNACAGLIPDPAEAAALGAERAYALQYTRRRQSHDGLFRGFSLAIPGDGDLYLLRLDPQDLKFKPAEWPSGWQSMHAHLLSRLRGGMPGPSQVEDSMLVDIPRFGKTPGGPAEADWLIAELDPEYIREILLPDLLKRHLGAAGKPDYNAEVLAGSSAKTLFQLTGDKIAGPPDASVRLLEIDYGALFPHDSGRPPRRNAAPAGGQGRWRLQVQRQSGSLEATVARARWQNLAISLGVLVLILGTVAVLVRLSRRTERLAELQMNFVAGVSHELRTPITVIRTAAYNLRGKTSAKPEQVEVYGRLIQAESEKLGALVDQILRFASARRGYLTRAKGPVAIETVLHDAIRSSQAGAAHQRVVLEEHIEPGLPGVLGDELAVRQVIQNLLDNALKYGTEGNNWIGVSAAEVNGANGPAVEIRIADRGPGIPKDEQKHIFDPFFRGRRAIQDQVHGTGLGLNLVKKIVEAHGGEIQVHSEPMKGTEFVIRIPAAPLEQRDEFTAALN